MGADNRHFKWWGVVICSLLLLPACSTKTVKEVCDSCSENNEITFSETPLKVSDSLLLKIPENCGEINSDIPPKHSGNNLYVLTVNNYLLKYSLDTGKQPRCTKLGKLPSVLPYISDYLVLKDSEVLFCSNEGTNAMVRMNLRSKKYTLKSNPDTTSLSSMPYMGLALTPYDQDRFIFPMVSLAEGIENHHFLGVYDSHLNYGYGIGNFRTYEANHFAPYFEAAILSSIENHSFYVTSSSSQGVLKCHLIQEGEKLKVSYGELTCFSKALSQRTKPTIKRKDLGNFKLLEQAFISDPYTVGIYTCGNALIRITKGKQAVVDQSTHLKNRLMDAPWTMEIVDLIKKTGTFSSVDALKFRFTNAFTYQNRFYVLSNQSDEKQIIYYVLYE
ncbi:hypothetical protein D3C71_595740 [compost metagenome]